MRTPLVLIVLVLLMSSSAQVLTPAKASAEDETDPPPRREVPDYDGRPPPPDPGDPALWIPRVLVSPLYFTSEFVLRRPLGFVVSKAEQQYLPEKILDFFRFGPEDQGTWAPTFLYEFGLRPSVGFFFAYDDFPVADNEIKVHAATWGPDWVSGTIADEIAPEDEVWSLTLRGQATRRPDGIFLGIGSNTRDDRESRYQYTMYDARLELELDHFWRTSEVRGWAGLTDMEFRSGSCCGKPSVAERVERNEFPGFPPGFEAGYLIYREGLRMAFDTRKPRPAAGHGLRLSGVTELAFALTAPTERRWLRYGGAATVFVDLGGEQNVLSASVSAHAIEPLAGEVPFTELVHPSGDGPLAGFVSRRLIGLSDVAAKVEYRWPIWNFLDASLHVAAGNVFDEDFANFDLRAMRLSYGIGVKSAVERDHSFQLIVALGTDEIDQGPRVESIRFTFGGTREF